MNEEIAKQLESLALVMIGERTPGEDELKNCVAQMAAAIKATPDVQELVVKRLQTKLLVKVDVGVAIQERGHTPWLSARKATIDPFYWQRYEKLLSTRLRWPKPVVATLGKTTDEILDLLGDPSVDAPFARRGLVLGHVQSGKTATYTALINKAADAGYGLVLLLTGTLENLRRQTQERLDEGFFGRDSSGELKKVNKSGNRIGVGTIDGTRHPAVFTHRSSDFRVASALSTGLSLNSLKVPALLVLKKNKKILQNLEAWLREYNADPNGKIRVPLLLIDDEADNASLNTRTDGEVTAINERIRALLRMFTHNSYVGFTATPFANIFVHPESSDEMLGDDLFPRDFIYSLNAPTNYVGPDEIFGDDSDDTLLCDIKDGWEVFPRPHKATLEVKDLPESLCGALDTFLIANVIRDLRGETGTHRSMLVNISRFTDVQNRVEKLLLARLNQIQADVRNFSKLAPAKALKNTSIERLHDAWDKHYSEVGFSWDKIQRQLQASIAAVTTTSVNQSSGPKALDYKTNEATGLRVVAVGGNSLSRGFTLEGLTVSYFLRTSLMYDTLLQMGRWFGYRDGYSDLCRVWMSDEARGWYAHITDAVKDLRQQVKEMREKDLTPKDFGLAVRAHPDALLITAYNKMRSATTIERLVSVSSRLFETVDLSKDDEARRQNWESTKLLVDELEQVGKWETWRSSSSFVRGISAKRIAKLVRHFRVAEPMTLFQPKELAEFIENATDENLKSWDVLFACGEKKDNPRSMRIGPNEVWFEKRKVEVGRHWRISGSKRRVSSRGDEAVGLDDAARARAEAASARERAAKPPGSRGAAEGSSRLSVSDRHYRAERTTPLLMVHLIHPTHIDQPDKPLLADSDKTPLVALSLSFCPFDDAAVQKQVSYKINVVKMRELYGADEGVDDDEEAGEDAQ